MPRPQKGDPLPGKRRELTREMFEELAALQCEIPEILGYVDVEEKKLASWCRRNYGHELEETLFMLRQDGLIEIRRASFDQLRKSATLIQQQLNRFLSGREDADGEARKLAARIFAIGDPDPKDVAGLFADENEE